MKSIQQIDKNFRVDTAIEAEDLCWFDPTKAPFLLHGLLHDRSGYMRMDPDVAATVSEGVQTLFRHTSGGRLSFETDSKYLAIHVKCGCRGDSSKMPMTGHSGFDLYRERNGRLEFVNIFIPPVQMKDGYEGIFYFNEPGPHKVLIHFPLYNTVETLQVGLQNASCVKRYSPYGNEAPVVFYGSSITQGGCVSRPGNSYPAIVSRFSGKDFICLGFSGSARGEQEMADYIASLPMSAFVFDYDHNDCDNLPRLEARHELFYKTVRKAHPEIPIFIMSAPYAAYTFYEAYPAKSKTILYRTYENAKAAGDKVFFIDGEFFFGEDKDAALTDRIHPNDLGHTCMAHAVLRVFAEAGIL